MVQLGFDKRGNNDRPIQDELSPRDLLFLKNLTRFGLCLIEIKVSPISPVIGKTLNKLGLPEDSIIINIIKDNQSFFPTNELTLESGDIVYFLASQVFENSIKEIFIPEEFKQ